MPIYEYRCTTCKHTVETLQKHSDDPPQCPRCTDSPPMKRQVSRTTFMLKGGGWAADGYSK